MARKHRNIFRLCVIRCGQTTWNAQQRVHGAVDLPLTEEGQQDVASAAERLRTERIGTVYHPDTEAAAQTASVFAHAFQAGTKLAADLADPGLGLWEGLEIRVFAERYPKAHRQWEQDPLRLAPPNGEPIMEARSRIFEALARIIRRSRSQEVAVVLPPMGLGLLRCRLADRPTSDLWTLLRDRPDVERYCLTAGQLTELEAQARSELIGA